MRYQRFTPEQEQWLRDNFRSAQSYQELAERFNAEFKTKRTRSQLLDKCFKQLKMSGMPNSGRYGAKPKEQLPVGTIRKSQKATFVKILEVPKNACLTGYSRPWWIPYQEKIYTDAYGPIPDGYMVCFLDNNPGNFNLNNLYPITRAIAVRLANNGWWSKNPEITLTAIKLLELREAIVKIPNNTEGVRLSPPGDLRDY